MRPAFRSLACLLSLSVTSVATAQVDPVGPAPQAMSSGVATYDMENFSGGLGLNGTYFDVRHQAFSGVGYKNGFTQFGVFAPYWLDENSFIAPNARLILTDDSATGMNGGVVARRYISRWDRIVGANVYYDLDHSQANNQYQQIGFGFETLGRVLDFRANGYVPINNQINVLAPTGLSNQMVFFGNRLGFLGTQLSEKALQGADFEFGAPVFPSAPWLRGYAGMYFYERDTSALDNNAIVGFRGRLESWVSNDLSVGVIVTTDPVYNTNVNAIVDWRFAGFRPTRYWPQWQTADRMMLPVQRHWRVTIDQFQQGIDVQAINPRDNQPYFVVWVDNSNKQAGSGTFENPYNHLPAKVPNETDLVLVRRGNTTAANPLQGSITLPDYARMLGEGYQSVLDAYANFGKFSVAVNDAPLPDPGFRNTGAYPFLTSHDSIVHVHNHNEVAAFVMENAGGAAITGTGANGFHFHHLELTNNAGGGIVLNDARGTGAVTADGQTINSGLITDINRNVVTGWSNPLGLGNNGPAGIQVSTGILPLDVSIARTSMNATAGAQDYGIRLSTNIGPMSAGLQDVDASGGNRLAGISLEQGTGALNVGLLNVNASSNQGAGIRALGGLGSMSITANFVNASANALSGIDLQSAGGSLIFYANNVTANSNAGNNLNVTNAGGNANLTLLNSQFNGSTAGSGISIDTSAGGSSVLSADLITATANAVNGLRLLADSSTLDAGITRSVFNNNVGDNAYLSAALSNFSATFGTDQFNSSQTGSGMVISATNGSKGNVTVTNSSLNSNAVYGMKIFADASAIGTFGNAVFDGVNVANSNLIANGVDGINLTSQNGAYVELFVDPTNMSSSGRHGFRFDVTGNSGLVSVIQDTNLNSSGNNVAQTDPFDGRLGSAVFGRVDGAGSFAMLDVIRSAMNNSGADGMRFYGSNAGLANINVTNSSLTNSGQSSAGAAAASLIATSGATANLMLKNTPGNNSGAGGSAGYGLVVNADGAGTVATATVTNGNFNNVGIDGVSAISTNGAVANLNLSTVALLNVGSDGLYLQATGGTLNVESDGITVNNAGRYGLEAVASLGGTFNACLQTSHYDKNALGGMSMLFSGAGTVAKIQFQDGSANANTGTGLSALVTTGAEMNLRAVDAQFNNNGTPGLLNADGVFVRAQDAGTIARLLFASSNPPTITTTADSNSRDGFHFEVDNNAYMTARIDNIGANDNGRYGVYFSSTNGAVGLLLPSGTNTLTGNGSGSIFENFNNTGFALVQLTGSFDGKAGDGVHVDANNVGSALVTALGNGTDSIDSNGGNGVFINLGGNGTGSAGVLIDGYSSISSNTLDGVHIALSDFSQPSAIQLLGSTNLLKNGGDGVDITLSNVALGTFAPPAGLNPVSILTLASNDPANACLPQPVNVALNSLITTPTSNGIQIDQYHIDSGVAVPAAGQNGISIVGANVTGTGGISLTNNTIAHMDTAVNVVIDPSNFGFLNVSNNVVSNSLNYGINFDGTNTTIGQVVVSGNTVTNTQNNDGIRAAFSNGGFTTFTATGNSVSNSGGNGFSLTGNGATGGDATITNLAVNNSGLRGVNVEFIAGSLNSVTLNNVGTNVSGDDGIHVDLAGVSGVSSVTVDGQGTAQVLSSGGNGISLTLNGVTGRPTLDISNYALVDNSTGNGVLLSATSTNVQHVFVGSTDPNNPFNIDHSGQDGFHLVLDSDVGDHIPQASGGSYDIVAAYVHTDNSGGDGWEFNLDGIQGAPDIKVTNPVFGSAGGSGFNFHAAGGSIGQVDFDPLTFTGNYGATGLQINLANTSLSSGILIDQVHVLGSTQNGIGLILTNVTGNTDVSFTGPSTVQNSSGNGILIQLNNVTKTSGGGNTNISMNNMTVSNSGGYGIQLVDTNSPLGNISITNTNVSNSTLDGIKLSPRGILGGIFMNQNTIAKSGGNGLFLDLANVTGNPGDITISNTTVNPVSTDTSGGYGILVSSNGATLRNVVLDTAQVARSGQDGIRFDLTNSTLTSSVIRNAHVATSSGVGINMNLSGDTLATATIGGTGSVTGSGSDGVRMSLPGVIGSPNVTISGQSVSNSALRGIALLSSGVPLGTVNVSNNVAVTNLGGQGILMDLSGAANHTVASVTAANNAIVTSFGTGLELDLNRVIGAPNVSVTGTQVDPAGGTSGGYGILVAGSAASLGNVTVDTSIVRNSSLDGIRVDLISGAANNVTISNATVSSSGQNGINMNLASEAINTASISGVGSVTTSGLDGIRMVLPGVAGVIPNSTPNATISGYTVNNSGQKGIELNSAGIPMNAVTVSSNTVTNSTGGQGIFVNLNGNANHKVNTVTLANNSAGSSNGTGVEVDLNSVTGGTNVTLTNTTVNPAGVGNSNGYGILVTGNAASLGTVLIDTTNVFNSSLDGIRMDFTAGALNTAEIKNANVTNSTGVGINLNLASEAVGLAAIDGAGTVTNSGSDGIRMALPGVAPNGAGTPNATITGYTVNTSGGRGIALLSGGIKLNAVTVSNNTVSTSTGGQGILIDLNNSTTDHTIGSVTAANNSISNSSTVGLELDLNHVTGAQPITISNSTINNSGTYGMLVQGSNVALGNVRITDIAVANTTTTMANDGLFLNLTNGSITNSVLVDDIGVTNTNPSGGRGINVNLDTITGLTSVAVTSVGNGAAQSVVTNSGSDGIRVNLANITTAPNVTVDGYSVTNSAGNGIAVLANGIALGAVAVSNNNVVNSTAGDGILVNLNSGAAHTVTSFTATNNTISGSSATGFELDLNNVTGAPPITISNSTITNSAAYGMKVQGSNVALGNVRITDIAVANTTTTMANDGLFLNLTNGSITNSVLVDDFGVTNTNPSGGRGINVNLDTITGLTSVAVTSVGNGAAQSVVTNSGSDGILVNLANITSVPNATIDGYSVSNSGGRGIVLESNGIALGAVAVSNNTVNTVTGGQGILIDLNGGAGHNIGSVLAQNNSISSTSGNGLEVDLNNVTGSPNVSILNTSVNPAPGGGLTGGFGILVSANPATLGNVLVDTTNVNNAANDGILVDLRNGSLNNSVVVSNAVVNTSGGNGIDVHLDTETLAAGGLIAVNGTGSSTNSQGNGILVNLLSVTGTPNVTISGYTVNNSGVNGIDLATNGNTVNNVTISNNNVSNSTGGDGILADLTNSFIAGAILLDTNTVNSSGVDGIHVTLDGVTNKPTLTVSNSTVTTSNGFGIYAVGNVAALGNINLQNDSVSGSATADGVRVELSNGSVTNTIAFNNVSSNANGADGINVLLTSETGLAALNFFGLPGSPLTTTINGNAADGISVFLNNNPGIAPSITFDSYSLSQNSGDGIVLQQVGTNVGAVGFSNNVIDQSGTHGVDLLITASSQGAVSFIGNQISRSGIDGVHVMQPDDTDGVLSFTFARNLITLNAGRGVNFTLPFNDATSISGTLNLSFTNDSITNNGLQGVNVALNSVLNSNVTANISINSSATVNSLTGLNHSDFSGNGTSGTGAGLYLLGNNTDTFTLTIGGAGGQNSFNSNHDAGVAIELSNSASATTTVQNAIFNGNLIGTNAKFFGDGFGVSLINNSNFHDSTFGNALVSNLSFDSNQGSGIAVTAGNNFATADNILIQNSTFTNNAKGGAQGGGGGGGGGITFHRNNSGTIGAVSGIFITGNTINNNRNGIDIEARSVNSFDNYSITNNIINGNNGTNGANAGNGIRFFVEFDGEINTVITGNTITNNRDDGIHATENASTTDQRFFNADVEQNIIQSNGGDGFEASTIYSIIVNKDIIDLNGTNAAAGGRNGINFNGAGTATIQFSDISGNGTDGIRMTGQIGAFGNTIIQNNFTDLTHLNGIDNNGSNGIEILSSGVSGVQILTNDIIQNGGSVTQGGNGILIESSNNRINATITGNEVFENGGDGIQLFMHSGNQVLTNNITINQNDISNNGFGRSGDAQLGGRGINIVNAATAAGSQNGVRTVLNVDQNDIEFNRLEAVYVVNTADPTQGSAHINDFASAALQAGGDPTADPRLALNITNQNPGNSITLPDGTVLGARIRSNGQDGQSGHFIPGQQASGVVVRIGTSDANAINGTGNNVGASSYQDTGDLGGFATNLTNAGFTGNVGIGNMIRGGVGANISNNTATGNFGADVTFQGYVSTVAPPTTAGTWTADATVPRTPASAANDTFGSTGQAAGTFGALSNYTQDPLSRFDLRFVGNSGDGAIVTRNDQSVDLYNNAEGTFKSRLNNVGTNGNGPFTSATRNRNATRLMGNQVPFHTPNPMPLGNASLDVNHFAYSGVAGSTWRNTSTSTTAGFSSVPNGNFGAVGISIGGGVGELPFIWDVMP